jgi:hypothetical protein
MCKREKHHVKLYPKLHYIKILDDNGTVIKEINCINELHYHTCVYILKRRYANQGFKGDESVLDLSKEPELSTK